MTQAQTLTPAFAQTPRHSGSGQLLIRRARFLAAMAVSAVIFWYFGWWVARPPDPQSAVTMMMIDQGVVAMAELLGLSIVVSGLAVAICGAGSAERGPLAVAVGLATLAAHGARMDKLVLYRLTTVLPGGGDNSVFPTWGFVAETWLWLALIAVGFVVGRWVDGWFTPVREPAPLKPPADPGAELRHSAGSIGIAIAVSWVLLAYFIGGVEYPIEKGQVYFAVAASFLIATLVSHWLFEMQGRIWMLAVVAVVASAAYVYAGPSAEAIEHARPMGLYLPLSPLARPLPIEYAAMGAIGVLFERDVMDLLAAMIGLNPAERSDG